MSYLDDYYAGIQARSRAPQLAYAVRVGDEIVASANTQLPFRIASMSKSFTAAATLLLRDRGLLALDTPIADIEPLLRSVQGPGDSPPVTVRHLLTMSSGLAEDDPWADRHLDATPAAMDQLFGAGGHFAAPTATQFVYSNFGYAMLGRIIERAGGMSFDDFITQQLLHPLNMHATTYSTPVGEYAKPHRLRDDEVIADDPPISGRGGFGPMGGLWSTVEDLLKWTAFLMDAFPARSSDDDGPLGRASRREMQQAARYIGPGVYDFGDETRSMTSSYCMGLILRDDVELGLLNEHSGGLPGYGSNMTWSCARGVTVISLANITYARMATANFGALETLRVTAQLPSAGEQPVDLLAVYVQQLVNLFNAWDDKRADEIFADNVVLDEPFDRRVRMVPQRPLVAAEITAINRSQAAVTLIDGNGKTCKMTMSLSADFPPRIQAYNITNDSL